MSYRVQKEGRNFASTSSSTIRGRDGKRWNLGYSFTAKWNAIDAAQGWLDTHDYYHLDVIDTSTGDTVWCSEEDAGFTHEGERSTEAMGNVVFTAEAKLPQPINVKREAAVSRLQELLDEETKKREAVEAREKEARLTVQQFVTDNEDRIVEWIGQFFSGSWAHVLEKLEETFKDDNYKPKGATPGAKETSLEKMVRVLGMSVDDTIEVQPDSSIYQLL